METLYANLYLIDPRILNFKAYVYQHVHYTENGVAYLYVDRAMKREYSLNTETAGDTISYLEGIRGCLCWLAFIEGDTDEDGIRVRLRSRFMTVNELASRHHGGGHACASGATVYSQEEMRTLITEADQAVKEFKESHTGWHTGDTFVTPVFNGSASLRDAAGQLIEEVAKSVRRKKTVDEAFMTSLYAQINSLYRLDQIGSQQGSIDTKADLGPLPGTAVTLLCALGTVWVLIGLYVLRRALKAKKH